MHSNKLESPQTGASQPYLDKIYAFMQDNQQFICCYCNFTALKLEANNVNKYLCANNNFKKNLVKKGVGCSSLVNF